MIDALIAVGLVMATKIGRSGNVVDKVNKRSWGLLK
jgi:hypothetical protein